MGPPQLAGGQIESKIGRPKPNNSANVKVWVRAVLESAVECTTSICDWNTNETYHPIMPRSQFMLAVRLRNGDRR
jgi:hypothetical protein